MYLKKFTLSKILITIFTLFLLITFHTLYKHSTILLDININEVPYISTYYIKPIVTTEEDVIINFYITNYNQSEYNEGSISDKFTVTIKMPNKRDLIIKNLSPGDNSINIGKFKTEGEQHFSIMCSDKYGRNSHELFNTFLVKNTTTYNKYTMTTDDLIKYNIDNSANNSLALSTINGLQKLLYEKKNEGYNLFILLPGIYVIDSTETLYIPNEFTLDLNNATIKLKGFSGDKALMISLNNTFNSHVINGTIEGDYYEHNYENSPNNSEWVNGIAIEGESKYSSFENLTVKNITGYGGSNGIVSSPDGSLNYSYTNPIPILNFKLGDIDRNSGLDIKSDIRTSSDYIDISSYSIFGYLTIGYYLGYQGNSCNTWNLICHFYDENSNYITSIDGYQYRLIEIPQNSKYIRITLLGVNFPTDLNIQLFRIPTHCSFKNIKFENCRAVGLAQGAMKDMLVENCEFINCGQVLAACAYDAEDGWDMMQDVTYDNLNFHDNPNNDFVTCGGHNFIIENIVNGKIHIWERTNSYVIKNCSNLSSVYLGRTSQLRTGYVRFYNNTIKDGLTIDGDNSKWKINIKDCTINSQINSLSLNDNFINCNIGPSLKGNNYYNNSIYNGNFINCNIHDRYDTRISGGNYINCTLINIDGGLIETLNFDNCNLFNINFKAAQENISSSFSNCTIKDLQIIFNYWSEGAPLTFTDCKIDNDDFLIKLPHYSMKYNIILDNNIISSKSSNGLIWFYDDRVSDFTNKSDNNLILTSNIFTLKHSKYVIEGLSQDTVNNINIFSSKNFFAPSSLDLCNPTAYASDNIVIKK